MGVSPFAFGTTPGLSFQSNYLQNELEDRVHARKTSMNFPTLYGGPNSSGNVGSAMGAMGAAGNGMGSNIL